MGTFKNMSSMIKPNFHSFIAVVLIFYILSDTTIPHELFEVINEPMIKIVLVSTCLYIIMHKPVVGCLALVAMYEIMTRNNMNLLPSLTSSLSPALSQLSHMSNQILPQPSVPTKYRTLNNTKQRSYTNYVAPNDKKSKIMNNFSANKKRRTLEEQLVNNVTPYYNKTEEASTVQPILAKQPNKNCVAI